MSNEDKIARIERIVEDMHKRLFIGNGKPSLMTQIDRHDQQLAAMRWVVGVLIIAVLGALVKTWLSV